MWTYIGIMIAIFIVTGTIFLFKSNVFRIGSRHEIRTKEASLTCEELEEHAKETAFLHTISKGTNPNSWPMHRMNESFTFITSVYKQLNEDVEKNYSIPPAAEWLLDNFYIIEEQVKGIRRDLSKEDYNKLPVLRCGDLKGHTRAYAIASELVAHTDGRIDDKVIINYLKAYQSNNSLLDREIWALSVMIRLVLIENIKFLCGKIKDTRYEWRKADSLLDELNEHLENESDLVNIFVKKIDTLYDNNDLFIEHLAYMLRRENTKINQCMFYLDKTLEKHGKTIDSIMNKQHNAQAVENLSIGNNILSLRYISTFDWIEIFETSSHIETILRQDPEGTYPLMDLTTRNFYRKKIEELASYYKVSETHIAKSSLELAKDCHLNCEKIQDNRYLFCESEDRRKCHVGYYIIDKGINSLEDRMGYRPSAFEKAKRFLRSYPAPIYLGAILFITLLLLGLVMKHVYYLSSYYRVLYTILTGVLLIIPVSDIAVCLVNWIVCNVKKPVAFPRLELKDGIPQEYNSIVVIPALLPDGKRVRELIESMETHYLANKEENLYFALLGDFKDGIKESNESDFEIIEAGINGVLELNKKYCTGNNNKFFYFHRHRQYNKNEGKWMGWERKRGALVEFNEILLGSNATSYSIRSNNLNESLDFKYVITLDADTILPKDAAKRMVSTMAHPLNVPLFDDKRGIVYEGYGLIQPRIAFDIESSNKSMFSRIFTGQEGLDPYACAISDVYQDLFGEGIFTGKGIYDLRVFQRVLKSVIPDNTVLSHDLLEGSYIRAGLVTDIELVDSYPSSFGSYSARLHRWVRGDWQLLPWLGARIKNKSGAKIKNPLSIVSRWKIFDNLRRSLVFPSLFVLIFFGFCVLPGNSFRWLILALLVLAFPLITSITDYFIYERFLNQRVKSYEKVISGLKASLFQIALMIVFLPYLAYLMINAISVTLIRVFFTKKNMLEWVTAADVEKGQKNSLKSFYLKMQLPIIISVLFLSCTIMLKPKFTLFALFLLIIWVSSPYIAYRISKTKKEDLFKANNEDIKELRKIARKTWRYFEEFTNAKNHYLPPDNFQEDPPNGIAYRTSPTNIGLGLLSTLSARDLGYIGTYEMKEILSKTVSTIENMDKWNGHLYNWYNTRTLNTLIPRYISTVDSGNLVCYLITLEQGLYEYLNKPLIERIFIDGIKDTIGIIKDGNIRFQKKIELLDKFDMGEKLNILSWKSVLESLYIDIERHGIKKSDLAIKLSNMVKMLRNELTIFMPWIWSIEDMPRELSTYFNSYEFLNEETEIIENNDEPHDIVAGLYKKFQNIIKGNVNLIEMPERYRGILNDIERTKELFINSNNKTLNWLIKLEAEILISVENVNEFISQYEELIARIKSIEEAMTFKPLYDEKKQLFSIGFNIEENRLTNSYYDLLASEARQTSFIAIARGEVPLKHWFKLGRQLTIVDHYKGLISWTGTMFEYLMPLILMKRYDNTLLDETYSFAVRGQKKYGRQRHVPWGVSESAFYSMDINLDYQYKAIGVPWLGLKRGLAQDVVVAPYATFLALHIDAHASIDNIKKLRDEGAEGPYGYYEAIDYTQKRMPFGQKKAVVKTFMVHHQGMSFLSLNNFLNHDAMQRRFHSNPVVKTAQLLLQEKVPSNAIITKEEKEKVAPFKELVYKEKGSIRKFKRLNHVIPNTHILSNGGYSVMLTDRGTGYSRSNKVAVSRWREDLSLDNYGVFFYIKNITEDKNWCATYSPYNIMPQNYEVTFTSDKAKFKRTDGNIDTETEVIVASGDNAEIRRVTLKNKGKDTCILEVTSYFEVVLTAHGADIAHPAFSNLFVRTEYLPEYNGIVANRRPRSESEKEKWIFNTAIVEGDKEGAVEFETDRMQFLGRGNNVSNPASVCSDRHLTGGVGPVLDPVMSLRIRVKIKPGKSAKVSFVTGVGETRDAVMELMNKYFNPETIGDAFKLALTRSQVEAKYLNLKASRIELYQDVMSHILFISPSRMLMSEKISQNKKGQSALWAYGISGDIAIVLVVLEKLDEIDIVYELLKAHEYWRLKDLRVDLVILNEEENSYDYPLFSLLSDIVTSSYAHEIINKPGGVFVLNKNNMPKEDISLLYAVARIVLIGNRGNLKDQIKVLPSHNEAQPKYIKGMAKMYERHETEHLGVEFDNEFGGFYNDGSEYVIRLEKGQNTPLPWINVIANPHFGFLATESGSGYTWSENSRENKLTPWSNDPVGDIPGEVIYIRDNNSGEIWSITPLPIREDEAYTINHGFGYSSYEHISHGIDQNMIQFVPENDTVKVCLINVKNISNDERELSLIFYMRPVLGVSDQINSMHIVTQKDEAETLIITNPYNEEFPQRIVFMDTSEEERFVTGDRKEFFGMGNIEYPDGLMYEKLSEKLGAGNDPCAAMQINIRLLKNEDRDIVFILGEAKNEEELKSITTKYRSVDQAKKSLKEVKRFWKDKLGIVKVSTPNKSLDYMLNGWLIYQIISCRVWARSAFYQSGGAYGFRDQLQDCLAIANIWPEITRKQILLHAKHQFIEGDVQHWWHEPKNKGTRTRFSDDLLWLPYVTAEYISISGDDSILNEIVTFVEDEQLKEFEDERYGTPKVSKEEASVYEHCIRAIEKSIKFGEHGIPLMGSGDWNDGMNTVGNKGKGESVWLGWFLCSTLKKFIPVCERQGDVQRGRRYNDIAEELINSIEKHAWDGKWYKRAYFDNGTPLGSAQNNECRIDSISQSWAVISEGGNHERVIKAMNSLEDYLVSRDDGLIKLLTPAFDDGELDPGYIKGYVPGVRENGGQYTHAAAWVIIAYAMLGEGDKAWEFFEMINPINHTRTHMECLQYKVEPYVMPADVYAVAPHVGRGGWTWYTGSASWTYRAGLEFILGFKKQGDTLLIEPCIPKSWKNYLINYKYEDTLYEIRVLNADSNNLEAKTIKIDGKEIKENKVKLVNDKKNHLIEVFCFGK